MDVTHTGNTICAFCGGVCCIFKGSKIPEDSEGLGPVGTTNKFDYALIMGVTIRSYASPNNLVLNDKGVKEFRGFGLALGKLPCL